MLIVGYLLLSLALVVGLIGFERKNFVRHFSFSSFIFSISAIGLFFFSERVGAFSAVLLIAANTMSFYLSKINHPYLKALLVLLLAVCALVLSLHLLPGIDNFILYREITLSVTPIDIKANIDKGIAGVFLLLLLINLKIDITSITRYPAWIVNLNWWLIPCYIGVILAVGFLSGLAFDPKFHSAVIAFFISNLLFSTIAEEAFFRGLMQSGLLIIFKDNEKYRHVFAIGITSFIFGLAHFKGGLYFCILATFAGVFYGISYHYSGRLSAAILTHIGVNLGHFLLLEYPVPV